MSTEQSKGPDRSKWTPWSECVQPQCNHWIRFIYQSISEGNNPVLGSPKKCWYHGNVIAHRRQFIKKYGKSRVHVTVCSDECTIKVKKLMDTIVQKGY